MRILVVEDGYEYLSALSRFLPAHQFVRAGSGAEALLRVGEAGWDGLILDMRFDRVADGDLLGDLEATADRTGSREVARQHLQHHQGVIILAALREARCGLPALIVHDFSGEARRWQRIVETLGPVDQVDDLAQLAELEQKLVRLTGS